jgi:translocation and assembly module TamA
VTEKIQAVAFYDAGYIGPDSWIGDGDNFHAGAGLGIRYQTGIGPIRLDVATPVAGNTGDGVQLYVGIGQAF